MANGDRAGLAMLRDQSAWVGIRKDNGATRVSMTNGLTMNTDGGTTTGPRRRGHRQPTRHHRALTRRSPANESGVAAEIAATPPGNQLRLNRWLACPLQS